MKHLIRNSVSRFSSITYLRGKPEHVSSNQVQLRGIKINSTREDSPNLIFFPEIFDQAENWLPFFTNPNNRILEQRNVYIVYPRNFGTSDHASDFNWDEMAEDVARFMYQHKIGTATLGGHGVGGKIALAAACHNLDKTTGYFGFNTTPMDQSYFEAAREIRRYIRSIENINVARGFAAIAHDLKAEIQCPKWRELFTSSLTKSDVGHRWSFNLDAVAHNLKNIHKTGLFNWSTTVGQYTGRSMFAFPEYSRFVHLGTNTLPMLNVCPHLKEFTEGISMVQGDENPQNHWIYELPDETNLYAFRLHQFLAHYDGVNVLLTNRDDVGKTFVPDRNNARIERDDFASDRSPAHYYHNWRFNNPY